LALFFEVHMTFEITSLYAGFFLLLGLFLSLRIAGLRNKFKVGIGTGKNTELALAVRVHGNFSEHVPFTLLGMALLEGIGGPTIMVHIIGALLILSRVLHAVGLSSSAGKSKGRFIGAMLTFAIQLVLGLTLILHYFNLVHF
jgi:uncharacterized membrane protein YecN with MAPEG domain